MGLPFGSALELMQIATPTANPPAGATLLYIKSDGKLYAKSSAGVESVVTWDSTAKDSISPTFSRSGVLTVGAGTFRLPLVGNWDLVSVAIAVGTAPTGASLIVDINKNGTTIYGTQGNRPTITAGTSQAQGGAASVTTFTTGDYLTVDIDQIGSSVAGSDLTVVVILEGT